jgi:hypothetical protein
MTPMPGGMAPAAPPAGAVPPPAMGATGPATVSPDNQGLRSRAIVKINLALSQLDAAVSLIGGSSTEEGRELMQALVKLRKTFGQSSPDLNRQEVKMLGQQAPAIGQPPGGDLAGMIRQRLSGMGMQGAPPAGPTPGG